MVVRRHRCQCPVEWKLFKSEISGLSFHQYDLGRNHQLRWKSRGSHGNACDQLMGRYLLVKGLFLSAFWVFPMWRSLLFVMSEGLPVFPSSPLPQPPSGWLPPRLKQTLSSLSSVSPCLLLIPWSISSPLPSQSVDGCYAVFHYRRPPHFIQASSRMMGLTETFLNSCSCHSAQGSERAATPQPSRNEEYRVPGLLCSVSHTHICISSQLLSTLPVSFACLALGVAPWTFCSPFLSPRRKVGHSDPHGLRNANWQVARVRRGCWLCRALPAGRVSGHQLAPMAAA